MKDKVCDVLHAQRWTLRIVITVDGVVFVRVQRWDAYYRNDPSKYGLDAGKVTRRTHLTKISDT